MLCRTMGTRAERDLGSAAEYLAYHPSMRPERLIAGGLQVEYVSQTLYDRRLPRAAPSDQNIQVWVEVNGGAIQEASFPRQGTEFRMFFGFRITVEPYSRVRDQERLGVDLQW